MITIYRFSPADAQFIDSAEIEGEEVPPYATATAPGEPVEGSVYVWDGEDWVLTTNWAGVPVYYTTGGALTSYNGIGELPEYLTDDAPPDAEAGTGFYNFVVDTWVANNPVAAAKVRARRNALLLESDFVMSLDCSINTGQLNQWARYRQWLRDMPLQSGFPATPTYPAKPAYTKSATLDDAATKQNQIALGHQFAIDNAIA